jgi:hypothetical protein
VVVRERDLGLGQVGSRGTQLGDEGQQGLYRIEDREVLLLGIDVVGADAQVLEFPYRVVWGKGLGEVFEGG